MKKFLSVLSVLFVFAGFVYAGDYPSGETYYTQISPTAVQLIKSGTGAITSVWAVQDITTRVTDVYIFDAANTWTARTEANTLMRLVCEAGQGWRQIYKGSTYDRSGGLMTDGKFQGISFSSGIVTEAATSTINAVIETR